jgi:hypothetical protein
LKTFNEQSPRSLASYGFTTTLLLCLLLLVAMTGQKDGLALNLDVKPSSATSFVFTRGDRCVMTRVNKIRHRHGLRRLRKDPQLGFVAHLQAVKIAKAESYFHDTNFGSEVTNWQTLGQNTGGGKNCRGAIKAFMSDPAHRKIILGPWRYQGASVKRGANGLLYVQHIFEAKANPGNIYNIP